MIKNKFTFLTVLIIVCIFGITAVLAVYLKNKESNIKQQQINTEAEALKQANNDTIKKAWSQSIKQVRAIDNTDHLWGGLEAPAQLIIYNDFGCPFCLKFYNVIERIKQEFGDNAVIAFRHYPLAMHTNAMTAAIASECAAEQGKFWQMYHKLFADNKAKQMNKERFKKDAVEIGLNRSQFNKCLETEKYKDKINAQIIEGKNAGVIGAPTIFVNGEQFAGAAPFEDYVALDGADEEGMKSVIERHINNVN
ncbi:MAG: thioredoxin domain-containing protein [Patescibacteria group bacterium]|nr:thioredoxin domain-containing protein [Patescibacteria group bacterium]